MPRKGGSRGNEIFGKGPRPWPAVEEMLDFALRDEEAPEGAPPPGLPELLSRRDAVLRFVAQAATGDPYEQLHRVAHESGIDLPMWMIDLPHALAAAKQVDEALDLARRLEPILEDFDLASDVAEILAEGGRRDEALARVEKDLAETDEPWRIARAGDVLKFLGEKARAQALYRKAQLLSEVPGETVQFIEREIPLLEELGRTDEVKALREVLESLNQSNPYMEEAPDDDDGPEESFEDREPAPPPARAEPTPSRNAPCPCGSGKKYKRCCGRSG